MHFTEEIRKLENTIENKIPYNRGTVEALTITSRAVAMFCGVSEESEYAPLGGNVTVVEMATDPIPKISFGDHMTLPSVFGDVGSYLTIYSKQAEVLSEESIEMLSTQRRFGLERLLARDTSSVYTVSHQAGRRIPTRWISTSTGLVVRMV